MTRTVACGGPTLDQVYPEGLPAWKSPAREKSLAGAVPEGPQLMLEQEKRLGRMEQQRTVMNSPQPPLPIPYTACGRGDRGVRNGGVGNEGVKLSLGKTGFGKDVLRYFCYVAHHPTTN